MEAKQPTTDLNPEKLIAAGLPLNAVSVDFGPQNAAILRKDAFRASEGVVDRFTGLEACVHKVHRLGF